MSICNSLTVIGTWKIPYYYSAKGIMARAHVNSFQIFLHYVP